MSSSSAGQQLELVRLRDISGPWWTVRGSTNHLLLAINLAAIVSVLTGHYSISSHVVRLNNLSDALCQSCMEEWEVESSCHFSLNCPAFASLRLKYLSRQIFGELSEVAGIDLNRLNKFMVSSKRLFDLWGSSDPLSEVLYFSVQVRSIDFGSTLWPNLI